MSRARPDYVLKAVSFDAQTRSQPFVDFGEYRGIVVMQARKDNTPIQVHIYRLPTKCLNQVYVSTKATNSVQFNSKWSGNNQLTVSQHLCLFLCPFGPFKSLKFLYTILPESNHLTIVLADNAQTTLSGSSSYDMQTDLPLYLVFDSGERIDNSFLRITYEASNDLTPTKQLDGFFPVFTEKLPEPLSMAAIIGISVGLSLLIIIIAILIVLAVIWKRKGFGNNQKENQYVIDPPVPVPTPVSPSRYISTSRPTLAVVRVEDAAVIETTVQQRPTVKETTDTSTEATSSEDESSKSVQAVIDGTLSFFYEMDSEYD
jgi:hypothetical protein